MGWGHHPPPIHMYVISYHNGAMGHTVRALIESCTAQFARPLPEFIKNENLHHYQDSGKIRLSHELVDEIKKKISNDHKIIRIAINNQFARLLVLAMSFGKYFKQFPTENNLILYPQYNNLSLGQQIEIFSMSIVYDEVEEKNKQLNADAIFDIDWFFSNKQKIIDFLHLLGLSVLDVKLDEFLDGIRLVNKSYLELIENCYNIAALVKNNINQQLKIDFFETCLIHFLLVQHYKKSYNHIKLLSTIPDNTQTFIQIFKD